MKSPSKSKPRSIMRHPKSRTQPSTASTQHTSTKIRTVEEESSTVEVASVYQYFRNLMGRQNVPAILRCFAFDPVFARHMIDLSSVLLFNDGFLTRREKELIATYISSRNACPYCFDSHVSFLLAQGASRQTVEELENNNLAGLPEPERQLLFYLGKVEKESFRTTAEDVQHLRDLGWREEQIAEAVHVAGMMGFCNRIANAFGLLV